VPFAEDAKSTHRECGLPILEAIELTLRKWSYAGSPPRSSVHVMGFLATPRSEAVIARGQEVRLS
jgi:hypothetical protein